MSVFLTQLPTVDAPQDLQGAMLLALIAGLGGVSTQKADTLLALDLIKQGEELDLLANP